VPHAVVYVTTAASVTGLRLLAIRYKLGLPVVKVGGEEKTEKKRKTRED
jgi:hypothetical protein